MRAKLLYSFRRCPYAMRARMALWAARVDCELREVSLADKPAAMLDLSPKGTVPVLQFEDGTVLEESADILKWALGQRDDLGWLASCDPAELDALIENNDGPFKHHLDRYKYSTRYEDLDPDQHWSQARQALAPLRSRLQKHAYLCGDSVSAADIALFPFLRQFRNVNPENFARAEPLIEAWLSPLLKCDAFKAIMPRIKVWQPGDAVVSFASVYGSA